MHNVPTEFYDDVIITLMSEVALSTSLCVCGTCFMICRSMSNADWLSPLIMFSFSLFHCRLKWIDSGLWSVIRHPNYLGEILLWTGLFVSASSTFKGIDYISVVSPLFIALLLTKVSGIPILERQSLKKWKDNPEFMRYFKTTPRLVPYIY